MRWPINRPRADGPAQLVHAARRALLVAGGAVIGGLMLTDRAFPGPWLLLAPSHAHMLFGGWFLQFAIGVAYWLLPRKRLPTRRLGYAERPAWAAAIALNLGLLLRVIAEPIERGGWGSAATLLLLALSALLQVMAIAIFVTQLWPRLAPRPVRQTNDQPA